MHAVVRVLGVEAAFSERSALPRRHAATLVRAHRRQDADGADAAQRARDGADLCEQRDQGHRRSARRSRSTGARTQTRPHRSRSPIGADWPSGVYAAQTRRRTTAASASRRSSCARRRRAARVAVAMPTSTWGAYNFYDADGDGWGDTWYARWKHHARRPDPPARDRRRPVSLPQLRPRLPALARPDRQERRHVRRRGSRAVRVARDAAGRVRPDRLPRPHRVRDEAACTTSIQVYRDLGGNLLFLVGEQLLPQGRPPGPAC